MVKMELMLLLAGEGKKRDPAGACIYLSFTFLVRFPSFLLPLFFILSFSILSFRSPLHQILSWSRLFILQDPLRHLQHHRREVY